MAKGWDNVQAQVQETAAARQRAQETKLPELRVNQRNPGPYIIRFGEQGSDVHSFYVHEYKVNIQGVMRVKRFTCLTEVGQECPGCQAGLRRKIRGVFNLIQRNRPVLRKGQDGRALTQPDGSYIIDGWQDAVVVANVGEPTAEMLRKHDGDYRGLMSRDFQVVFSGDTFQSWSMTPVIDQQGSSNPTPLSENDQILLGSKHDLDKYMQPPSAQEAAQIVQRYGQNSGAAPVNAGPVGGHGGAQGNAGLAQQPNGFLAGAAVPGAAANAFGAAAGLPQAPPMGVPPVQPQPVPVAGYTQPPQPPAQQPTPQASYPQAQQPPVQPPPPAPAQQAQPGQGFDTTQSGAPPVTPPPVPPPAQVQQPPAAPPAPTQPQQQGVPAQTG